MHIHTCIQAYTHAYTHTYTHTHIHTYIHMHIHMHIHANTYMARVRTKLVPRALQKIVAQEEAPHRMLQGHSEPRFVRLPSTHVDMAKLELAFCDVYLKAAQFG
jgi:hypothetical protein